MYHLELLLFALSEWEGRGELCCRGEGGERGGETHAAKQSRESTLTFPGPLSGTNTATHRFAVSAAASTFVVLLPFLSVAPVTVSVPRFLPFASVNFSWILTVFNVLNV